MGTKVKIIIGSLVVVGLGVAAYFYFRKPPISVSNGNNGGSEGLDIAKNMTTTVSPNILAQKAALGTPKAGISQTAAAIHASASVDRNVNV